MSEIKTQLVVLGAGPGGYAAAFRAADLGVETVIVDARVTLGGVCLNVGCIPSKALLHVAKVIDDAKDMAGHGVSFVEPIIDLDKVRGWKDSVVDQLTKGLSGMAKMRKVKHVQGYGKFTGSNTLEVEGKDGKTTITFDNAVIGAAIVRRARLYPTQEVHLAPGLARCHFVPPKTKMRHPGRRNTHLPDITLSFGTHFGVPFCRFVRER